MKSLTNLINIPLTEFGKLDFTYHYLKPERVLAPYAVWQEQSEKDFHSDNSKSERVLEGIIDFYTLIENDPKLDLIEEAMETIQATWALVTVLYENETKLIHYSWEWSIK
jgi:hypothetical protein